MSVNTDILVRPIITEKATSLSEDSQKYSFFVAKGANKIEIKKAVEQMYNVTVKDVNTMIVAGKSKTRYTNSGVSKGQTKVRKKAIVTLVDGDQIDFYSGI